MPRGNGWALVGDVRGHGWGTCTGVTCASNGDLCKKIGFNELITESSKSDQLSSIVEQV